MENYRINVNYAKALFLLATDTNEIDVVCKDMELVNKVCEENRILNVVFSNPTMKDSKKIAIINELFENAVSRTSMAFLNFVVRKHRAVSLRGISGAYLELYRKHEGIVLSELRTATDVDEATKATVTKILEDFTHKKVQLNTVTDSNMIGGFCVEFDNNMYDARVRTQIERLRKEFSVNKYEKAI